MFPQAEDDGTSPTQEDAGVPFVLLNKLHVADTRLDDMTQPQAADSDRNSTQRQGSKSAALDAGSEDVGHTELRHETQPALPQTLEYLQPMTALMHEALIEEFSDMMDARTQLDYDLLGECEKPNGLASYQDREALLRRVDTLVREERNILRGYTLELKARERLLL